jgi:hypothetical protein
MIMTNSPNADVMPLLSKQEEAIASLYAAFSVALPEMKSFWDNLVAQEKAHAEVCTALVALCESKSVELDRQRFRTEAIVTNIQSMKEQEEMALSQGITAIRALSLAADIEKSLIESQYFRVIASDHPDTRSELEALESHTQEHILIVENRLKKEREINQLSGAAA